MQRVVVGFVALGFAAVLAMVVLAGGLMSLNRRQTGWVAHTYQVERQIAAMQLALAELEGHYWRSDAVFQSDGAEITRDAEARLMRSVDELTRLTRDNPRQQARIPLLRATAERIRRASELGRQGHEDQAKPTFAPGAGAALDTMSRLGAAMIRDEDQLLTQRLADQRQTEADLIAALAIVGGLLALVGTLTFLTLRRHTRDLSESREDLRRLNAELEEKVRERTAGLTRANHEVQRFAYIISHDLRSPLVNIMGFTAELETATTTLRGLIEKAEAENPDIMPEEARGVVTEDIPEAIHFIRASSRKMDRLIAAILRLSREGSRTLHPETVDLGGLCGQVVDATRHRIDEAGGALTVADNLPSLVSDRLALEQILSNLIENAVKYRQAGREPRIGLSARRVGPRVVIEVADNGRGIDPRDHERIFDLFRRSGLQDQTGEGIGLAHVRALSYRLGGTITVHSRLGEGSTFVLDLPAAISTGDLSG